MASPYSITSAHHGEYEARDLGGLVAVIQYDTVDAGWTIRANGRRYPTTDALPDIFHGRSKCTVPRFGDVFRFFGLPLPGAAAIAAADIARAERALVERAHERGAAVIRHAAE